MKALVFERKPARYAAAVAAGAVAPGTGAATKLGPLRVRDVDPPELPGPGWVLVRPRLAGICGSDLATLDGSSSRWFEPIVSFPFTPGHEVVGDIEDAGAPDGVRRVVVEPVLGCVTRNVSPPCAACARGELNRCERIASGDLAPGLQTGYCCDTGGGWSPELVAHPSQLHDVPDDMDDATAVMVEPTACAVHAALAAGVSPGDTVVVIGAGTLGLLTVAALRRFTEAGTILVAAKHPEQVRWAGELGADATCSPTSLRRAVRRITGGVAMGDPARPRLAGGAPVVADCVGSEASLTDALAVARPGGRIALVGMAGRTTVDLTPLWQRELSLTGAYAYGTEHLADGSSRRTFDLALELAASAQLGRLVSATYPLRRYPDAVAHAADAGSRGAVKIAFDLRPDRAPSRRT
jgi:threonine dehydrogenase-like Zn-dependent dehydrogenase